MRKLLLSLILPILVILVWWTVQLQGTHAQHSDDRSSIESALRKAIASGRFLRESERPKDIAVLQITFDEDLNWALVDFSLRKAGSTGFISIARKLNGEWLLAFLGEPEFVEWLQKIPEGFIDLNTVIHLSQLGIASLNPTDHPVISGYHFPYSTINPVVVTGDADFHIINEGDVAAYDFSGNNTPVVTSRAGSVIAAVFDNGNDECGGSNQSGNANYVVVRDDTGKNNLYAHLAHADSAIVQTGEHVEAGDLVGYVGRTGWTNCTYHLHFAVTAPLNPGDSGFPWGIGSTTYRVQFYNPFPLPGQTNPMEPFVTDEDCPPTDCPTFKSGNQGGITLYEGLNYTGGFLRIGPDGWEIPDFSAGYLYSNGHAVDDTVSSIRVSPYWSGIFYKDTNYPSEQGYIEINQNKPNLSTLNFMGGGGGSVEDNISSARLGFLLCISPITIELAPNGTESCPQPTPTPFPTPPPATNDSATFIAHITLPNGTVVSPGQALLKTWRMQNIGTNAWGSGYQLVFLNGDQMGAPGAVNIPSTDPGELVDISVNMVAPLSGGGHTGYWQLRNPQGTYFGPVIEVSVTIPDGNPPPTDGISLICLDCSNYANVTPGQTFRPTIQAVVSDGQLLESRGDMLRNKDGNLFGSWPHISVVGTVNANQPYNFTFYEDNPLTAPSAEGTYETRWQIWRDGNWAGPEIVIHFDVVASGSNHRPNQPSALSPGDWWVQWDGGQVQLCAQHNGDPDGDAIVGYEFDVTGANTWNSGEVSTSCVTTQGLGFFTYGWIVRVKDSSGEWSDWSDPPWRFTIHNAAAIQGPDFSPPSPSTAESGKVWACSNGGTMKYFVNLANDGSENGIWWQFNEGPICPDPSHSDPNLWPGWQTLPYADGTHIVRVENGLGGVVKGPYTLLPRRPAPPELFNPPHQSFQNTRTITFNWGHGMFGDFPTRATSYTLRVSTDPDPTVNPILVQTVDAETTSFSYAFDQDYPSLYWKVTSINALGSTDSGVIFHFGIDQEVPSSSVAPLPPISSDTAIIVSWGGSDNTAGIRWYDIQYMDSERGEWVDWQNDVSFTSAIFVVQPGHQYFFRARALDNAGNQEEFPPNEDGDTNTLIDLTAAPPTAWWNDAYAYKRNLLVLNNDSDNMVAGYPVHLHFDGGTTPSASDLFSASQSTVPGDDFSIIYNNDIELSRWIQTFSADEIDIWFKTQADIVGNDSDNTSYQLYYNNPSASNPPADIDDVMPPGQDTNAMGIWHLMEGTGSSFADSSGRGHDGTLVNTFNWGEDSFGTYIEWFGGLDGPAWGEVPSSSDFDLTNQLTIEAWVFPIYDRNTPEMDLLYRPLSLPDNCPGYKLAVSDMKVDLQLNCAGGRAIDGTLSYDHWYHIATTFDGSNMRVYHNGVLIKTVAYDPDINPTTARALYLGGSPENPGFGGRVRHVRLSNIARTDFSYAVNITAIDTAPSLAAGAVIVPPGSGEPDLAVLDLRAFPNPNGGVLVQAVVQNQGTLETINGFYTDLYVNDLPGGSGDYGIQFWVNDPISIGEVVTLTTVINDLSGITGNAPLSPASENSGTLYTQADSSGVLGENDEDNNIFDQGVNVCVAALDLYEGDNDFSSAQLIGDTDIHTHNFSFPGDADWIKFNAVAGETYSLQTFGLDSASDTYLYLYDTDGTTLLASNDDYNGTLASHLDWTASTSGTYYVRIAHWNPNVSGCGTKYYFSLQPPKVFLPIIVR